MTGHMKVFVRDRAEEKTRCVSLGPKKVEGNGESSGPSMSADGSMVSFESDASNLVKRDTNNVRDVFANENSTSGSSGKGSSFVFFFDLLQRDGFTGGFFISFD